MKILNTISLFAPPPPPQPNGEAPCRSIHCDIHQPDPSESSTQLHKTRQWAKPQPHKPGQPPPTNAYVSEVPFRSTSSVKFWTYTFLTPPPLPCVLHIAPSSSSFTWSPQQVSSTNYAAPHYAVFTTLLLPLSSALLPTHLRSQNEDHTSHPHRTTK
jgi:hypothetical protein